MASNVSVSQSAVAAATASAVVPQSSTITATMAAAATAVAQPSSSSSSSSMPSSVISVSARDPSSLASALRSVEMAYYVDPPPENWNTTVQAHDDKVCQAVLRALVDVHKAVQDPPMHIDVVAVRGDLDGYDSAVPPAWQKSLLFYHIRAFGFAKPVYPEEMVELRRSVAPMRVSSVFYDPSAQGSDPQNRGALVVRVTSLEYSRAQQEAHATIPVATSTVDSTTAAAANPAAGVPTLQNGKKRRFSWKIPFLG
jgi:hypothetical protein